MASAAASCSQPPSRLPSASMASSAPLPPGHRLGDLRVGRSRCGRTMTILLMRDSGRVGETEKGLQAARSKTSTFSVVALVQHEPARHQASVAGEPSARAVGDEQAAARQVHVAHALRVQRQPAASPPSNRPALQARRRHGSSPSLRARRARPPGAGGRAWIRLEVLLLVAGRDAALMADPDLQEVRGAVPSRG